MSTDLRSVAADRVARSRAYEYRHIVGFEETNLVGNVYYINPLRWQGRCRELFLRDCAPDVLNALADDLVLVTIRASCEYLAELQAFDEVVVRMTLRQLTQSRIAMAFEYWRSGERAGLVARGQQEVACMRRSDGHVVAIPVPAALRDALQAYA